MVFSAWPSRQPITHGGNTSSVWVWSPRFEPLPPPLFAVMETLLLLPSSAVLARAVHRNLALVLCPTRGPEMLWFHRPQRCEVLVLLRWRNFKPSPITCLLEVSHPPSALLIPSCPCPAVTHPSSQWVLFWPSTSPSTVQHIMEPLLLHPTLHPHFPPQQFQMPKPCLCCPQYGALGSGAHFSAPSCLTGFQHSPSTPQALPISQNFSSPRPFTSSFTTSPWTELLLTLCLLNRQNPPPPTHNMPVLSMHTPCPWALQIHLQKGMETRKTLFSFPDILTGNYLGLGSQLVPWAREIKGQEYDATQIAAMCVSGYRNRQIQPKFA